MTTTLADLPSESRPHWSAFVLPKEHGSWSLAFEPIALGLLCAPSIGGAFLATSVAAAFFCRRPLRIALLDQSAERRHAARGAVVRLGLVAAVAFAAALVAGGVLWLWSLLAAAVLGGAFLAYDLKNAGRDGLAEVFGAAAFASLPATFAALHGWSVTSAFALAGIMTGRAVPTVILVRAAVRGRKIGRWDFAPALGSALGALLLSVALAFMHLAPPAATVCFLLFLGRAVFVQRHPALRAKTLGMIEAIGGVAFVLVIAAAW